MDGCVTDSQTERQTDGQTDSDSQRKEGEGGMDSLGCVGMKLNISRVQNEIFSSEVIEVSRLSFGN